MPLTVEIVTPARKVFTSAADSVLLPAESGQLGILPGHIPLIAILKAGQVVVKNNGTEESLIIDSGLARVIGNTVSILTESTINPDEIDLDVVAKAEAEARKTLETVKASGTHDEMLDEELKRLDRILQFSAAQRLYKTSHR